LVSNGIVDSATWAPLVVPVRQGSRGDAVKGVQEEFQFRNGSGDPSKGPQVDGIFGPVTKDNMNAEFLYDDPFVVAAGARNPWCRRRRIKLADLMNEPWTLPPRDSPTGSIVVEVFRASGLEPPRAALVASSIPVRNALLASGRFLTMVPASVLKLGGGNQEIQALPIDIPTVGRPIGILTLKNRTLSPVANLFVAAVRDVASSISGRANGRKARVLPAE
jgi:DNA-binding transcriptional LysR family regulator